MAENFPPFPQPVKCTPDRVNIYFAVNNVGHAAEKVIDGLAGCGHGEENSGLTKKGDFVPENQKK